MRFGVFGDIHANIDALTEVLEFFRTKGVRYLRGLGDQIGYCGSPGLVVDKIQEFKEAGVLEDVIGNHDEAMENPERMGGSQPVAREILLTHKKMLTPEQLELLRAPDYLLRELVDGIHFWYAHASQSDPSGYHYIQGEDSLRQELQLPPRPAISFISHTHVPELVQYNEVPPHPEALYIPKIEFGKPYQIRIKNLVNTGSVGQPRSTSGLVRSDYQGDPRACCVVVDTDDHTITFHKVAYNIQKAIERIEQMSLPPACKAGVVTHMGKRLRQGI
jgi:diadenosine tetraphosphatase ApaH/serine/threonine PP2A family protein phosphatase